MRPLARLAAVLILALALPAKGGLAQTGDIIRQIRVEGNQRIEVETIRSHLRIEEGDRFAPGLINESLKNLFGSGLFYDVSLRREGGALVVRVVENPIINRIAFEGNERIKDEILAARVQLRPRFVYTRTRVQRDVALLLELYRRGGRFAARVEPKVIQQPQNRVDLVFEIEEGAVTRVRKIAFVGNKRFSDRALRGVISTTESRWYQFLTSDDVYDPDRLNFDRDNLRKFYLKNGYVDFQVASVLAELTRDRSGFIITFTVAEGGRYRFGKIDVETDIKKIDPGEMRKLITAEDGEWYDAGIVSAGIQEIETSLGNEGFAFAKVRPKPKRNRETRVVDVTFQIEEGPRTYIERINISGNDRTRDEVIRREFRLQEGDAFSTAKIRRSRRRIRNLGFFNKVEVSRKPSSDPEHTIINVEVEEKSTGELSFGAGASSEEGLLATVGIRERNLLGRGQDLRLNLTLTGQRQQIDLSFTEPYFLDRELAAGFDVFNTVKDRQSQSSFDSEAIGLVPRVSFPLAENLRQSVRYTIRQDKISNVSATASRLIRDQEGTRVTSAVGQVLTYDTRDSRFDPREGRVARLKTDVAGLGGALHYLRASAEATQYLALSEDWIASFGGKFGHIVGLGEDVRIGDRFFVGGVDLRGFRTGGIGPRDRDTADALGGNTFYVARVEMSFPTGLPNEFALRGRVFSDFGSVFGVDSSGSEVIDTASTRVSVGFGLSWLSPFGPIRVDFAEAVLKEDTDLTETFRFTFGTRF